MSKQSSGPEPEGGDVLDIQLKEFVASRARAGYSEKTRRHKERLIAPFIRWVQGSRIAAGDVDEACVDAFLACPSRRRYGCAVPI